MIDARRGMTARVTMAAKVTLKLNDRFYKEMRGKMSGTQLKQQMRLEAEDQLDDVNWDRVLRNVTASRKGVARRKGKARRQSRS